jgi:Uma2 family endonuclease
LPVAKVSVEEYLAIDRAAEVPSEYRDGEMVPMVAVSWEHSVIGVNVGSVLKERLAKTPCRVAGAPLRVRVSETRFVLPDVMVVCGKPVLADEHNDTLTNPKVIIEILSPSTADYDYGHKFILYRRIESFEEYVLVAQDEARVEVFRKTPDKRWVISTYEGLDTVANIESLGISFQLADVYAGVELPAVAPGS